MRNTITKAKEGMKRSSKEIRKKTEKIHRKGLKWKERGKY